MGKQTMRQAARMAALQVQVQRRRERDERRSCSQVDQPPSEAMV
jgi:hypothetical protein